MTTSEDSIEILRHVRSTGDQGITNAQVATIAAAINQPRTGLVERMALWEAAGENTNFLLQLLGSVVDTVRSSNKVLSAMSDVARDNVDAEIDVRVLEILAVA